MTSEVNPNILNFPAEMKILIISHLFFPARGGVESHLTRLSRYLAQNGYQIEVLTTSALSTEAFFLGDKRRISPEEETIDGVHIKRLGFKTFGRRTLNFLRSVACRIKYPLNQWIRLISYGPRNNQFIDLSLEAKPDVIVAAPLPMMTVYYGWKAAQIQGVPLIINPAYHINDPCSFENPIFFRLMGDADIVAVHTETEKEFLAQKAGLSLDRIEVLPPLPFEKKDLIQAKTKISKQEARKKYGIKGQHVLLFVGQHGRHKNIDLILKAMPLVWKEMTEVEAVIAGGTTAYTEELKSLAYQLAESCGSNFKAKIKFIDDFPQERKEEIFALGDIFISLSKYESFGIVFAEAMIHKLPVIASQFSIARSIIDDFQTGLLINPHCEIETAGAIIDLLEDDKLRKIYGEAGYEKVKQEFDPDKIINKWAKILNRLGLKNKN